MKQLNFVGLPQIAIAEGATSPNPGYAGVQVWSTTLSSMMFWNGTSWSRFKYYPYVSDTEPDPNIHPIWYNTSGEQFVWDGEIWFQVIGGASGSSGAGLSVSLTAPADPVSTPLWYDLNTGSFLVWVDDGTFSAWVEVGAGTSLPTGGAAGALFVKQSSTDFDAIWTNTLTAHLSVPAGASGTQVPQAQEVLLKAGNLSGLADNAVARSNLGLGSAATRTALGTTGQLYSRDSVLGTVSQSAGVPTGALIERGSNANGEYAKFADGTMICTFRQAANSSITIAQGSLFVSSPISLTFAATFAAAPICLATASNSAVAPCWSNSGDPSTTGVANIYLFSTSNTATARVSYIAIGRWF